VCTSLEPWPGEISVRTVRSEEEPRQVQILTRQSRDQAGARGKMSPLARRRHPTAPVTHAPSWAGNPCRREIAVDKHAGKATSRPCWTEAHR